MKAINLINNCKKADLARALGVTPQVVNGWVKRNRVPAKYLADMAKYFKVKVGELL